MKIKLYDWLRFTVTMDANNIKVSLQMGVAKSDTIIIQVKDDDIMRGKLGVGVRQANQEGNKGVFFSDVSTYNVNPIKESIY